MRSKSIIVSYLITGLLLCFCQASPGQSLWSLINATSIGGDCYQLTKNKAHERAAAWSNTKVNLLKPFDLYFQLKFGSNDNGADGIVVVLQNAPSGLSAIGQDGMNLGYAEGTDSLVPSIDIEFDTYMNGWPAIDIADDHCAINGNGAINWTLAPAVPLLGAGVNVEDNTYHIVRVAWEPVTTTISVYFDCTLIQTLTKNIMSDIFQGDSMVYYGLTAGTGVANNAQYFCELYLNAGKDSTFCPGTPVTLNANSNFTTYSWSPANGLSCTTCLNPEADPNINMTYVLTGNFGCLTVTDSMNLTTNCQLLPIELTSFTAACDGDIVKIIWSTASEYNNDYFIVERSSDAVNYEMINTTDGAGNSLTAHSYSFIDEHPLPGTSYYRLKQVDVDETATYSNVESASCNTSLGMIIYPNPTNDETHLVLKTPEAIIINCFVTDLSGNIQFQKQIALKPGDNIILLQIPEWTPGVYNVSVASTITILHSLLVIQ